MGLLPWGLSRILGITVYLDIPADTAWSAAGGGGARARGHRPHPAVETALA